jgi:hypothetical protein
MKRNKFEIQVRRESKEIGEMWQKVEGGGGGERECECVILH